MICPDCGLKVTGPTGHPRDKDEGPFVCPECLRKAIPRPLDGWPIIPRWISGARGRGVFARDDLERGVTVERCWVMPLSEDESMQSLAMPILNRYLFPWIRGHRCVTSGEGLLYNFDRFDATGREPNVQCVLREGISAIEFRTLRAIKAGEELTWNYNNAVTRSS